MIASLSGIDIVAQIKKRKVLFIFGTRPEAIKMAPVIRAFLGSGDIDSRICVSGQHCEMLQQVLDIFELSPDYNLDIMVPNQTLHDVTTKTITGLKEVFDKEIPDLVFVQGDTTTSMSAALAGFYDDILVAHIEAGLRTYEKRAPFPEEINRRITGLTASWHFAPTETAKENLLREGVEENTILVTGNTVVDALHYMARRIKSRQIPVDGLDFEHLDGRKFVLITGHRRENFGKGLENICRALRDLAYNNTDINFVYSVHLNPNVQNPVYRYLREVKNIYLIPPQNYEAFIFLLTNCLLVLTDSGGIQEEAPSFSKPVLVMREKTERPEAILAGTAKLVGTDTEKIVNFTQQLLENPARYDEMAHRANPFGDGHASERILTYTLNELRYHVS